MGAWGSGAFENDTAYDLIAAASDQICAAVEAALDAGDAPAARAALRIAATLAARVPAVAVEDEALDVWRERLHMLETARAALPGATAAAGMTGVSPIAEAFGAWLRDACAAEVAQDNDLGSIGALALLASLAPAVAGLPRLAAETLDDWEPRVLGAVRRGSWRTPAARLAVAREVFAALREGRAPRLTHTELRAAVVGAPDPCRSEDAP